MIRVGYFLGTFEDWGGASRALLNFVKRIDKRKVTPVVVLTKEGRLSAKLRDLNIECAFWAKHELSRNLFSNAYHVLRSWSFLKANSVDIVHVNYGAIEWKSAIVLAAKWSNIPIVYHYHVEVKAPSPFVSYASAIIVVSDYLKEHSETLGRPTYTVHNIVDVTRFASGQHIREKFNIPADCVVITFLGQLKIIKGINMFLRATRRIKNPDVRFLIAGEFREKSDFFTRQMFDELVLKDNRIVYLGYREDVVSIYSASDIVVVPSQWDEPFGLINIEAGAASKPVIATRVGGIPEVIEHGVNGFLVERNNMIGLCNYMSKLIENQQLRSELGKNGRDIVERKFTDKPVEQLEHLYDSLLKAR